MKVKRPIVHFYHKSGCHLCKYMARGLRELERELGAGVFEVVVRDIKDDERWRRRYRLSVPLLMMGQREICRYFFDKESLKAALADADAGAGER